MNFVRSLLGAVAVFLYLSYGPVIMHAASFPAVAILQPPDRSLIGGAGLTHVVVELKGADKLLLRHNGKPVENVKANGKFFHATVPLEFGLNKIETQALKEGKVVAHEAREVFFFSPIAKFNEIPKGFVSKPFHLTGPADNRCASCHVLQAKKTDFSPPSPTASSCYSCHSEITGFRQVHGPAALWHCLRCHDATSAPAKYATPVPVRDLCYQCHQAQKKYFFSARYQHGPTATGMCTICHNPHASNNEFWLKKEPWDLCTTCHEEKASGRHVLAWGPTGDTHPTRGRPDPMKPEREFSCRSCHNPHASNAPKLWNFDATTAIELCWTCHRK